MYNKSMKESPLPELDKSKFTVASIQDETDEKEYWFSKTPQDRLAAVEVMRQIVYGYDPVATRLQRILEIAEQTPG